MVVALQSAAQAIQDRFAEGQNIYLLFKSDIVEFLFKTSEGRDRRPIFSFFFFFFFVVCSALIFGGWVVVQERRHWGTGEGSPASHTFLCSKKKKGKQRKKERVSKQKLFKGCHQF